MSFNQSECIISEQNNYSNMTFVYYMGIARFNLWPVWEYANSFTVADNEYELF